MIKPIGFDETEDEYIARLEAEVERLQRRVVVLEMVIQEELDEFDCCDDANRMIVESIHERGDAVSEAGKP